MKRILAALFTVLSAVLFMAGSGIAQSSNDAGGLQNMEPDDGKVTNLKGEELGKISHVVMDSVSGRAVYVIINNNENLYPVPADLIAVQAETGNTILDVDKEKFLSSPSFTADNMPDLNDAEYGSKIYRYYGVSPFWEREGSRDEEFRGEPEESPELPPGHPPIPENLPLPE